MSVPAHDVVRRATHVFATSSSSPVLVECEDGSRRVLKASGAGAGPAGLLTELVASRVVSAHGVKVPKVAPLWLPGNLPWEVGTDEFDEMMQRSPGWNLGIEYVADARIATFDELRRAPRGFVAALVAADRFVVNVDRTASNPNVLVDATGSLNCIDHESCLFLSRALSGGEPDATLPRTHLFATSDIDPCAVVPPSIDWEEVSVDVPDEWLEAAGLDRRRLISALVAYERRARREFGP